MKILDKNQDQDYVKTLRDIKERVHSATQRAFVQVNYELVNLYWEMGKTISEKQEVDGWGSKTIDSTLPKTLAQKGSTLVKDDYNLDFLQIEEDSNEKTLEAKIIEKIDKFIKELDNKIMYAGRQVRLKVGLKEFHIDLLFYHKVLRSYVIIELKSTDFKAEHVGKMGMYLSAVEEKLNDKDHDSPAICITLCKCKDRDVFNSTLKYITRPIGISTYKSYESAELPKDLLKYLPNKSQIERRLLDLVDLNR